MKYYKDDLEKTKIIVENEELTLCLRFFFNWIFTT